MTEDIFREDNTFISSTLIITHGVIDTGGAQLTTEDSPTHGAFDTDDPTLQTNAHQSP